MGPAGALLGGSIRPRRSSRGAVRKLAARPLVALVPMADPEGPGGHSPRAVGPRGWPKGKAAGRLSEGRPTRRWCGTRGDARGPAGSLTAHCPGSDRPWAVQRRAPYVHSRASASRWAVRMRTARIARMADRLDGMPRCHPRVWPWWLHTHARGYAVHQPPGETTPTWTRRCVAADRAAALGHSPHCGHVGCAALHSLQQVAAGCCLLQRAVVGCNRLSCIATGCHAQQQIVHAEL